MAFGCAAREDRDRGIGEPREVDDGRVGGGAQPADVERGHHPGPWSDGRSASISREARAGDTGNLGGAHADDLEDLAASDGRAATPRVGDGGHVGGGEDDGGERRDDEAGERHPVAARERDRREMDEDGERTAPHPPGAPRRSAPPARPAP